MAREPSKSGNPIDKHVGTRVRMLRLIRHVSQTQLGDALGITFQQVQKYEKGTNRISASRLQQMSDILKVPVPFFFEGAPGADARSGVDVTDEITAFLATTDGLTLAQAFTRIRKPKLRRCIVDMVEDLAKRG
jgi:transcriptional regulator with XRE-family HTH domain